MYTPNPIVHSVPSCPQRHFIATLAIGASYAWLIADDRRGPALIMWPATGRDHRTIKRAVIEHPVGELPDIPDNPGFVVKSGPNGLVVTLSCRRCPGWTLTRDYQRLAAALAVYALAGHREYRL